MKETDQKTAVMRLSFRELYPHPLLDRIGVLPDMIEREARKGRQAGSNREDHKARAEELSVEFAALVADIAERGIQEPVKVSRGLTNWLIADGRNRWLAFEAALESHPQAAVRLEAEGIPCIEIPDGDAPAVILSAMTRRHMKKQARSLMAVKLYPEVAEAASAGRPKKSPNEQGIMTQPALAAKIGVSLATMEEACLFWRKIKLELKREQQEAAMQQVFAGISFAKVELGLQQSAKKGQAKKTANPRVWSLMTRNANSMLLHWKAYEECEDEKKKLDIREKVAGAIKAAPADVKAAILAALEGGVA